MPQPPELSWLAGATGLVGRALLAELAGRPVLALLRLTRPLAGLIPKPWRPITPDRVARAMRLALGQAGPAVRVLESGTMQTLGAP